MVKNELVKRKIDTMDKKLEYNSEEERELEYFPNNLSKFKILGPKEGLNLLSKKANSRWGVKLREQFREYLKTLRNKFINNHSKSLTQLKNQDFNRTNLIDQYMYVRLGGEDLENGKELKGLKNLDQYQGMVLGIKNKINRIKEDIEKRKENIKIHGYIDLSYHGARYQNKDRIVADLRIRKSIDEAEEEINTVEILVKKKAASYSKEDLNNRNKTIGLLRKNLVLLRDDIMGDKANVSVDQDAPNKIFGDYNNTDSDQISPKQVKVDLEGEEEKYVDRELTEEEKQALVQFKKNDEELDQILDKVIAGLGQLEEKGNKLHEGIERQNELLKKTNKKVEKTNLRLRQQNNHLKDVLQKIRSTNKLCCDLCLVL